MADDRHEARRAIASWKVARFERRITAAIVAALAIHKSGVFAAGLTPGTPPPDPFNLTGWNTTVDTTVAPAVSSVMDEIVGDVAKASAIPGGKDYLLGKTANPITGATVKDAVSASTDRILLQVKALGTNVSDKVTMAINTASDEGKLADSMNSLFTAAETQSSYVARSANFFANGLAQQAALTVQGEGQAMQKTWTSMGDDQVRPDHEDVDGTTVGSSEPFNVGGEDLMYPGDPDGSEEEVANCRCWLVFEPAESADDDAIAAAASTSSHTVEVGWLGGSKIVTRRAPLTPPNRKQRRAARRQ